MRRQKSKVEYEKEEKRKIDHVKIEILEEEEINMQIKRI